MIIESDTGMESNILPETALVMAFRFSGNISYATKNGMEALPMAVITGIRKTVRHLQYSAGTSILLIKFREGAAMAFFKQPLHEIRDKSLDMDHFLPSSLITLFEEQLSEADDNIQRIALTEKLLLSMLRDVPKDVLVLHTINRIIEARGDISVRDLLLGIPVSRDAFEKRFRKSTGTSPKQFSTIIRLNTAIKSYPALPAFTDIALSAGYYDQSHFIKDFRKFTGQPPRIFFTSDRWW